MNHFESWTLIRHRISCCILLHMTLFHSFFPLSSAWPYHECLGHGPWHESTSWPFRTAHICYSFRETWVKCLWSGLTWPNYQAPTVLRESTDMNVGSMREGDNVYSSVSCPCEHCNICLCSPTVQNITCVVTVALKITDKPTATAGGAKWTIRRDWWVRRRAAELADNSFICLFVCLSPWLATHWISQVLAAASLQFPIWPPGVSVFNTILRLPIILQCHSFQKGSTGPLRACVQRLETWSVVITHTGNVYCVHMWLYQRHNEVLII